MKKFFMIAVMAVAALSANAQLEQGKVNIFPYLGVGYGAYTNAVQGTESALENGMTAVGGADVQYNFAEKFGLSAGLNYQYYSSGSEEWIEAGKTSVKKQFKLGYLNIPVLAHIYVSKHFGFRVGVKPAILLSAKNDDRDFKDACNTFHLSIPMAVVWKFNSPLELAVQYDLPVTRVNKDDYKEGQKNNNFFGVYATIGWRF